MKKLLFIFLFSSLLIIGISKNTFAEENRYLTTDHTYPDWVYSHKTDPSNNNYDRWIVVNSNAIGITEDIPKLNEDRKRYGEFKTKSEADEWVDDAKAGKKGGVQALTGVDLKTVYLPSRYVTFEILPNGRYLMMDVTGYYTDAVDKIQDYATSDSEQGKTALYGIWDNLRNEILSDSSASNASAYSSLGYYLFNPSVCMEKTSRVEPLTFDKNFSLLARASVSSSSCPVDAVISSEGDSLEITTSSGEYVGIASSVDSAGQVLDAAKTVNSENSGLNYIIEITVNGEKMYEVHSNKRIYLADSFEVANSLNKNETLKYSSTKLTPYALNRNGKWVLYLNGKEFGTYNSKEEAQSAKREVSDRGSNYISSSTNALIGDINGTSIASVPNKNGKTRYVVRYNGKIILETTSAEAAKELYARKYLGNNYTAGSEHYLVPTRSVSISSSYNPNSSSNTRIVRGGGNDYYIYQGSKLVGTALSWSAANSEIKRLQAAAAATPSRPKTYYREYGYSNKLKNHIPIEGENVAFGDAIAWSYLRKKKNPIEDFYKNYQSGGNYYQVCEENGLKNFQDCVRSAVLSNGIYVKDSGTFGDNDWENSIQIMNAVKNKGVVEITRGDITVLVYRVKRRLNSSENHMISYYAAMSNLKKGKRKKIYAKSTYDFVRGAEYTVFGKN